MSILNRLRLSAHLDDAALAAIWTDGSQIGAQIAHPHLERCATCRVRFADLTTWLDIARLDATAEADENFPPKRLASQHALVFRRLEAAERPARVIAFPRFTQPLTSRTSNASRWVAAAAAAGLIVGVGVGQLMDLRHSLTGPSAPVSAGRVAKPPAPIGRDPQVQTLSATRDEAFLSALDASLSRAAVPELRALDAFTPRAGDRSR